MACRWAPLFVGFALVQGIFTVNSIPEVDEESVVSPLNTPAYRLPTNTRPRHYEVVITPYFEDNLPQGVQPFTFDGQVTIYIQPQNWFTNQIVLHCNDMTVHTVTVSFTDSAGNVHEVAQPNQEFTCLAPYSFLYIQTELLMPAQEYVVSATFTGNINSGMRGFYRSWYIDSTGNKRWMGTTQFQPGHARQAFPCYDEPGFKATFDITINRPAGFSPTLGNMPLRSSTPLENGRTADAFYTSPYTSTYLLAFIVSHYERIETNGDAERPFDIYARNNVGDTGKWSLEIGEQLLETMEVYTDIPYYTMAENLNMKQAAIPDFSANAMENWGLLTYREAQILYDPLNSNHFYKQRVANIVAHEIAHMWIGNLVTCAWWDVLWLNEGFARFYQYFLTEMVRPDLYYTTRFIIEQVHDSLMVDSVDSAHPMTDPSVNDPASVTATFSAITYARGASVIRMTQHFLGNETFVKGLQNYLKARSFDVALPTHLFAALDGAAREDNALAVPAYNGITIGEYLRTWTEQAGHPLLTVIVDQRTGQITVTQRRWERNVGVSTIRSLYVVPITWTRGGEADFRDTKPSQVLTAQTTVFNRGTTNVNEWVIFNKQQVGFFRINYDDTNWALITQALRGAQRTDIHEYNRGQIVDDVLQFARAGVLRYERAFNILSFLRYEDEYVPWMAAINGFNWIVRRLAHDADSLAKFQAEVIELSTAVVNRLGWSEIAEESYLDGLFRMYLGSFLCSQGHPGCIAAAETKFTSWLDNGFVPANERPWVYCEGLRQGTAANFDVFWNRYLAEDLASEKLVMLENAGCTNDQTSLEKYLDAIVADDDSMRAQDFIAALNAAVSGNEINTMRVFTWLTNNLAAVQNSEITGGSVITYLQYIIDRLHNEEQIATVQAWLDTQRTVLGESTYNSAVNAIGSTRTFLAWSETRVVELANYLETGYVEDNIDDILVPEPEPQPEPEPDSEEDEDDGDPDSANIAALSLFTLLVTLAINMVA